MASRGRPRIVGPEQEAEVLRLHGEGLSQADIGGRLGLNQATISNTLRRLGVVQSRVCRICGQTITPRKGIPVTCGRPECVAANAKDQRRYHPAPDRTCAYCGQSFHPHSQQRFCSAECRLADRRQRHPGPPGAPRRIDRDELVRLYHEGVTQDEIAKRLNCTQSGVGKIVRELGLTRTEPYPMRTRREGGE